MFDINKYPNFKGNHPKRVEKEKMFENLILVPKGVSFAERDIVSTSHGTNPGLVTHVIVTDVYFPYIVYEDIKTGKQTLETDLMKLNGYGFENMDILMDNMELRLEHENNMG